MSVSPRAVFGLLFILLSMILACPVWYYWIWPPRGNSFGGDGLAVFVAYVAFAVFSPILCISGLFTLRPTSYYRAGWALALPALTTFAFLLISLILKIASS